MGVRMANIRIGVAGIAVMAVLSTSATALDLRDAVLFVVETNPEIKAAEANKQAIEFELDQGRSLYTPRVNLEARTGYSYNDGDTTPDLSSADDAIFGGEGRVIISQMLWDGWETRSEVQRQAYRVDGAALRVLERSEFLGLESARLFTDVLRERETLGLARANLRYHEDVLGRIRNGFETGVLGLGDLQQAEERLILAQDIEAQVRLDLASAEVAFTETVGVPPVGLTGLPDFGGRLPSGVDAAAARARVNNPTLRFAKADVGASEALHRKTQSNRYPDLFAELEGRLGENLNGFEGRTADARAELVLRYVFQGNQLSADRQEQLRRVNETRARLLQQARLVESEVRQTWARLGNTRERLRILERQNGLSEELLTTYEAEFEVGTRSLLDLLNTQNSLLQTQVNLTAARYAETFEEYRLLAASGDFLSAVGVTAPEDAVPYAAGGVGAPPVRDVEGEFRNDSAIADAVRFRRSLDKK